MTKAYVTAEEFVRVWQSSSSTAEVSKRTGMPKPSCSAKAGRFRMNGVPLKKFVRRPDWDDLADFARNFTNGGGE